MTESAFKQTWKQGTALAVVLLAVAVAAALVLFLAVPAYRQHLTDADLTMDSLSVSTARDVASVTYLQDGANGLQIYYYDEVRHECVDRDQIGSITPYGRTLKQHNMDAETGARGIPNLGDEPQLLAVAVSDSDVLDVRWTGKTWRYLDYYYMYPPERATLTPKILREMDDDSKERAEAAALAEYEKDFEKLLKKEEDPGEAVYDYSAISDFVFYDEGTKKPEDGGVTVPEHAKPGNVKNLKAYGLADEARNKVLQVTVADRGNTVKSEWIDGDV